MVVESRPPVSDCSIRLTSADFEGIASDYLYNATLFEGLEKALQIINKKGFRIIDASEETKRLNAQRVMGEDFPEHLARYWVIIAENDEEEPK